MLDSSTPEFLLNLERVMYLFDKYFPSGHLKRVFKQAFGEKVKKLDQDKEMAICLSKDKDVASSFLINKSKTKKAKEATPTTSNTPKKRQPSVSGATPKVPEKKVKKVKTPPKIQIVSSSSSSSASESEEDLEEKLRKYISQGFAN